MSPPSGIDRRFGFMRFLYREAHAASRAAYREEEWVHHVALSAKLALAPDHIANAHAAAAQIARVG